MCVEFVNDTLNAVWGDTRNGKLNIWYSRLDAKGNIVSIQNIATETLLKLGSYPNPFTNQVTIKVPTISGTYLLEVFNTLGETVFSKKTQGSITIPTQKWESGPYFYSLTIHGSVYSGKILKQ